MDWIEEVRIRLNKNNRILFTKKSAYLQDLVRLFQEQNHRIMALWAFDFAEETVARLEEKYPEELRPREALEAVRDWAAGKLKMRAAQQKILACHAFAKEIESKEDISLCHAVGQACAVVHTAGHAVGGFCRHFGLRVQRKECMEDGAGRQSQQFVKKSFFIVVQGGTDSFRKR